MKHVLMAGAAALALSACNAQQATQTAAPTTTNTAEVPQAERVVETTSRDDWGEFGLDLYSMDTSVHPGDDFFRYMKDSSGK